MPYSIKRLICFLAGIAHRILRHRTHHEKRPRNLADLQHSLGDAFSIVSKVKFGTVKVCFDVSLPEPLQADRAEHALDDGVVEQPASPRGDGMARRRVEGDEAIPDQRREARVVDDAQRSLRRILRPVHRFDMPIDAANVEPFPNAQAKHDELFKVLRGRYGLIARPRHTPVVDGHPPHARMRDVPTAHRCGGYGSRNVSSGVAVRGVTVCGAAHNRVVVAVRSRAQAGPVDVAPIPEIVPALIALSLIHI